MYNKRNKGRNSLGYKIDMWFYNLTTRDKRNDLRVIGNIIIDFITALVGFLILCFLPAFFH